MFPRTSVKTFKGCGIPVASYVESTGPLFPRGSSEIRQFWNFFESCLASCTVVFKRARAGDVMIGGGSVLLDTINTTVQ